MFALPLPLALWHRYSRARASPRLSLRLLHGNMKIILQINLAGACSIYHASAAKDDLTRGTEYEPE
jgi:hypothetical protein